MVAVVPFENEPRWPVLNVLELNLRPLVVYRNSLATPNHVRILFLEYGGRQATYAIHSVRPIGFARSASRDTFRRVKFS
jgi:hypothetical protein